MELKTLEDFLQVGELVGDVERIDDQFSDVVGNLYDSDLWYILTFDHNTGELAGMSDVDE